MTQTRRRTGLPRIGAEMPQVLILGSLPGDASLRAGRYYAHPRNQFWGIIAEVLGFDVSAVDAVRHAALTRHNISVWDVLASAHRQGSLDTAIRSPVANDFSELLIDASIQPRLLFNGQAAHKLFQRHVARPMGLRADAIDVQVLPSTSPAYTKPFEAKRDMWKAALLRCLDRAGVEPDEL